METDAFAYSGFLNTANTLLDPKVRAHWVDVQGGTAKLPEAFFDCVLVTPEMIGGDLVDVVKVIFRFFYFFLLFRAFVNSAFYPGFLCFWERYLQLVKR